MQNSFWSFSRIASIIWAGVWICSACGGSDDPNIDYTYSDQATKNNTTPASNKNSGSANETYDVGGSGASATDDDAWGAGGSGANATDDAGPGDWDMTLGGSGGLDTNAGLGAAGAGSDPIGDLINAALTPYTTIIGGLGNITGGTDVGSCQTGCSMEQAYCASLCTMEIDLLDIDRCKDGCLQDNRSCVAQCAGSAAGAGGAAGNAGFAGSGGQGAAGAGGVNGSTNGGSIERTTCRSACNAQEMVCTATCATYIDVFKVNACTNDCGAAKDSCRAQCG
jgi:hypothetical protein